MHRVFELTIFPFKGWTKIAENQPAAWWVTLTYLLPWLILGTAVEAWGLVNWGRPSSRISQMVPVPREHAILFAQSEAILILASVLLSAVSVYAVARSFQVRCNFSHCWNLTAYSYGPILLARFLDAAPFLPSWACWGIGAAFSISILYSGVGSYLKPDQTKGFGLYLVSCLAILVSSGLAHALALAVLDGKIKLPMRALPV